MQRCLGGLILSAVLSKLGERLREVSVTEGHSFACEAKLLTKGAAKLGATPSVSMWISAPYDRQARVARWAVYAPLQRRG